MLQLANEIKTDIESHKPLRGLRKLAFVWLGDSACCGSCIGDDETAPAIFETLSNKKNKSAEAINLSVVGYNIRQIRELYRQRSDEFKDVKTVVYYHHCNDIINAPWWRLAPSLPTQLRRDYDPPGSKIRSTLRRSALLQYLTHTELGIRLRKGPQASNNQPNSRPTQITRLCLDLYAGQNRYATQFEQDLKTLAEDVKKSGANFVVIWWPTRYAETVPGYLAASDTLKKWTTETGAKFIDVTQPFVDGDHDLLYVDPDHPSGKGQHLIAETVLNSLSSM